MILESLDRCMLFDGVSPEDRGTMLSCLGAKQMFVKKHQAVFSEGDPAEHVGIVLTGLVQLVREDYYGNRSMIASVAPGELFGESFACAGAAAYPINAVAAEDSHVLLIKSNRITATCCNACSFHNRMIYNMLRIVAANNLTLNQKIDVISKRTIREKLMAYLMAQAKLHNSSEFSIPYDRQALADYLEVDRSAMSAEISKLRKEGILESEKNKFRLL